MDNNQRCDRCNIDIGVKIWDDKSQQLLCDLCHMAVVFIREQFERCD